jgi:integrase
MKIKYVDERQRADGTVYWAFNPPKYLKEALGVTYRPIPTIDEARAYSSQVDDMYIDHKRRKNKMFHIQDTTVNGIFAYYQGQEEWLDTAENTKRSFRMLMRNVSETRLGSSNKRFGDMLARNITTTHAKDLKNAIKENFSHHRSIHCMKVMRLIWNIAKSAGRVSHNPFEKMRLKSPAARKVLWEPEHVEQFVAECDATGQSNLSLLTMMCYHLCQRPGDMRQVTFDQLHGDELRFVQEKTGTPVELELTDELLDRIQSSGRTEGTIVLNDVTKRPHTRWSYYKQAKVVMKRIGLPEDLRISDLRRTGATELAESGCTEEELRSVTGHQSRDVLNIYVRPTRGIARNAMKRRFG